LYVPSRDVEANGRFYPDVLGGRVIFAIAATGTRVAEWRSACGAPDDRAYALQRPVAARRQSGGLVGRLIVEMERPLVMPLGREADRPAVYAPPGEE
jgi:hypothetical protein